MPLSEHVFGHWLFSHEEDGARIYRPRAGRFVPSRRPRDGFDIDQGGGFRVLTPGPADASDAREGRWTAAGERVEVAFDDGGPGLALEIVHAAAGVLKVRRG